MPDPIVIVAVATAILLAAAALAVSALSAARATIDGLRAHNRALLEEIQAARDDARRGAEREHQLYRELASAKAYPVVSGGDQVAELLRLMSTVTQSLHAKYDGPPPDPLQHPVSHELANVTGNSFRDALGAEGGGS